MKQNLFFASLSTAYKEKKIIGDDRLEKKYRFRIHPTDEQVKKLQWTLDQCMYVYNRLLNTLKIKRSIDEITSKDVTLLKRSNKFLKDVYCRLLYSQITYLFKEWRRANEQVMDMNPKSRGEFTLLPFYNTGYRFIQKKPGGDVFLELSKIGRIPIDVDQDIEGQIRKVIVEYDSDEWYVSIATGSYCSITAKHHQNC